MATHAETESRESYWKRQVQSWQSSGLTMAEYCRQSDISKGGLGYWRRKLLLHQEDSKFVEVQAPVLKHPDEIRIRLTTGIEITVSSSIDARCLRELVQSLEQL